MIRPTVFGYLRVRRTVVGQMRPALGSRKSLEDFAEQEGFAFAQLFTDISDDQGPFLAFDSLIEAAGFTEIVAVLIPDWSHLGSTRRSQDVTHARLEEASLPVLAITCTDLRTRSRVSHPPTRRLRS